MSKRRPGGQGTFFDWIRRDPKTGKMHKVGYAAMVDMGRGSDGKRLRKTMYGKTEREVTDRLNEALRDNQRGVLAKPGHITVAEWLTTWLQRIELSVRPRTWEHYSGIVRLHLVPTIGAMSLTKLTSADVQRMLNAKRKAGLSPRSVHHLRSALRNALNIAVEDKVLSRNVAAGRGVKSPQQSDEPAMRVLDPDQANRFLEAAQGIARTPALYVVALGLGLRAGEVTGLRWSDIDLEHGELRVTKALQWVRPAAGGAGTPQLVQPKSRQSRRTINMPGFVTEALREHRAHWRDEKLQGLGSLNEWDLVFTQPSGAPLNPRAVWTEFQAILVAAKLPRIRFHDLRHSCASLLLAQGVPARMIMELLGHSQISLTMNTYSHVLPSVRKETAAAMDRILGGRQ